MTGPGQHSALLSCQKIIFQIIKFQSKRKIEILNIFCSFNTVKPLITNTSKEFINSLKLFPHIHGYLFIFANTEIYVI